jgi:hypothetical protein
MHTVRKYQILDWKSGSPDFSTSFLPVFPLAWTEIGGDPPLLLFPAFPLRHPPQSCPGQSVSSDIIWDSNEQSDLAFK